MSQERLTLPSRSNKVIPEDNWLSTNDLAAQTGVEVSQINYLRKEGVIIGGKKRGERTFYYHPEAVTLLRLTNQLGVGETQTESARIVASGEEIKQFIHQFLHVISTITLTRNPEEIQEALNYLSQALGDETSNMLDDDDKKIILALIHGEIQLNGTRAENIQDRYQIDRAKRQLGHLMIIALRLVILETKQE